MDMHNPRKPKKYDPATTKRSPMIPSFVNIYEFSSISKFNNKNKLLSQNIIQSVHSSMILFGSNPWGDFGN